jgi:dihydroorotate dehydrogenase electron transfer subunit
MSLLLKEKIIYNKEIAPTIYKLVLESEYLKEHSKAGQFINIKCSEGINTILRRPISISSIDYNRNTVTVFYQTKGRGTNYLAQKSKGETLDLIGPLGTPFTLSEEFKKIAVVGGGIGIFPLLFLLEQTPASYKTAYIGFKNKKLALLINEFQEKTNELLITTEDGSLGHKGFITDLLNLQLNQDKEKYKKYDIIYACGPEPMMEKVVSLAHNFGIKSQISLEQRMGCGIGACLACVYKIKTSEGGWQYKRVCKDGPVFWGEEVDFNG